ncbi:unnamed protein product, partial [Ectocarpus sp. 4 AP-2014]
IKQTVKELVDNAIDSCRCRTSEQDAPTVRVVLRRSAAGATVAEEVAKDLDLREEPLELQVADNGAGLTDVTNALGLFSSTKSGHTPPVAPDVSSSGAAGKNAGKYGLGLTLSLLYSQKHFGGFLKATTATMDSTQWSFTKCDIDLETGTPRTVYRKSGLKPDSWAQGCGTDMRLLVPGDEEALDFAGPRLKAFFARMHLLPDRPAGVSFACEGCLDNMSVCVPRGGRDASPHLLLGNQDLVRAFAKGLSAMAKANKAPIGTLETPPPPPATTASLGGQTEGSPHSNDTLDRGTDQPQAQQHLHQQRQSQSYVGGQREGSSIGSDSQGTQRLEEADSGGGGASSTSSFATSFPGHLDFAAEDVAVFECQGKNSSTWVMAAVAVERAPPTRDQGTFTQQADRGETTVPLFVHRFANGVPMLDTNTSAACALVAGVASKGSWRNLGLKISSARVRRREGRLRFVLSEAPTPLKVNGGADWSALADIKAVHVAVTANSQTVPYTSLRKDAIAHKEGYVSAAESAVGQGLLSLSNRESGGFRSAAEAAKDMMQDDLIPLVASSVASMVNRSADANFQKKCLQALGVGHEYVQERRLSDLLRFELQENIRQEEERRVAATARAAARRAEEAGKKKKGKKVSKEKKRNNPEDDGESSSQQAEGRMKR